MNQVVREPAVPLVEVVVDGALDADFVPQVRRLLDEAAGFRPWHVVVDLARCPNLDAAGIEVRAGGGRLSLRGLSGRLHRMLAVARVEGVLQTAAPSGYAPRHRAGGRARVATARRSGSGAVGGVR
ncbi:STAS domain-containing protein [Dactylosporangium aurantiacum]|uniref:STAS domain-containing protein n=1 Tax=Dactylosporangium aurantiacum TaxID=35754 RepID=A0A9Q9IB55_9ACTN|nr:STAS domain-containing protein [Dactylosporangium aurantiacum]MDG6108699.1 STAS domain-containing protein [Dactylosporangium aurantiacum]UWZ51063.1 STAS domain-containing protein [Dactylosporangium aurantiacum]